MKQLLIVLVVTFSLSACQKDKTPVLQGNDELVGTWIYPQYTDTLVAYTKAASLVENEPGFTFKPDNSLIYRQNSGWCGTPPITTADYEGTWSYNDSVISISTSYWGGKANFSWKVISHTNQKLVIWIQKAEYLEGK